MEVGIESVRIDSTDHDTVTISDSNDEIVTFSLYEMDVEMVEVLTMAVRESRKVRVRFELA